MASLRFLQFSDLHLDSAFSGARLNLPPAKRDQLRRDAQTALTKAMAVAVEREVDVILCPGDLWDDESVSLEAASHLYDEFARVAPVPVLITPGNHDPGHSLSYHDRDYYQSRVGRPHPPNVHVFPAGGLQHFQHPSLEDVDFFGLAFSGNVPRTQRALADIRSNPTTPDHLCVFLMHGSRDDVVPPAGDGARPITAPFSAAELLATNFDYTAVGHYHRYSVITDPETGLVRSAYAGCTAARGLDETGLHGVLIGEIDHGGVIASSLELIEVEPRRFLRVSVEISAEVTNAAALQMRVESALNQAGCRAEDVAFVKLMGYLHPDLTQIPMPSPEWMERIAFHVAFDDSALEPEHDPDALSPDRLDGAFALKMKELMAQETDPVKCARLRKALFIGLDALNNRPIRPRDAH
jgi:hypothetical protein